MIEISSVSQKGDDVSASGVSRKTQVLLVTGISGAGRSTTLKIFEDLGYEAIDNLPLKLLPQFVVTEGRGQQPLAIGIDIRSREFSVEQFLIEFDVLIKRSLADVRTIYLDCTDEVLQRRFSETRRRHPLARARSLMTGIQDERQSILPLRDMADLVVDTSELAINDLRRLLRGHFATDGEQSVAIFVVSFSYRYGVPREADIVFDSRFLANPYYDKDLRPLNGLDDRVAKFVKNDPGFDEIFQSFTRLLELLIPRFQSEGKSYLTIAIGCTGGRHRSVFLGEELVAWLRKNGQNADIMHRELPGDEVRNIEELKKL
jgi:UPF0042 nucleotide-binding protein